MMNYNTVLLVVMVVLGVGLFGNIFYKAGKSMKYKNDERWLFIQNKATRVIYWYQGFLTVVLAILLVVDLFQPIRYSLSVPHAIMAAFMLLFLQHGVEWISLMVWDKAL